MPQPATTEPEADLTAQVHRIEITLEGLFEIEKSIPINMEVDNDPSYRQGDTIRFAYHKNGQLKWLLVRTISAVIRSPKLESEGACILTLT